MKTDDLQYRIRILEEKFEYQERTIDDLNEVIIEQQHQLNLIEEQMERLRTLFSAIEGTPDEGQDPPPPHY